MGRENIQKRISDIEERIKTLNDGKEKELASFERDCLNDVIDAVEGLAKAVRYDSNDPNLEKLRRSYASLAYLDELRREGKDADINVIRENAGTVSDNETYRKLTYLLMTESSRDGSSYYEYVPGEEKGYHLSDWIKELDSESTPDYGRTFDDLAAKAGINDAGLKNRYISLSEMNERIKGVDRKLSKSPEELFAIITDKEDLEKASLADDAAQFFKHQDNTLDAVRAIEPSEGKSWDNVPACIRRVLFCFLEQDTSPDATERNREVIDRLASGDPKDIEFKRDFLCDSINRLLEIRDEDLTVQTKEEKLNVWKKYGVLIDALFDFDQNFSGNVKNDFYVKKSVLNVIKHKAHLLENNITNVKKEFENDSDPRRAEQKLLKDIPVDDITKLFGACSNGYMSTDDPGVLNFLANAAAGINDEALKNAGDKDALTPPDPEKYDGHYLLPDEIIAVTAVSEPEKPGRWASFVSGLTSAYNATLGRLFGKAKDPYEAEFKEYAEKKAVYDKRLADRKKGLDAYKKDAEIYDDPEKRAAQEKKDVEEKNRRMTAKGAHDAYAANQDRYARLASEKIQNVKDTYKQMLDSMFSDLEHRTKGELNRIDHVMIGHKTLRSHLETEYALKNPDVHKDALFFQKCDEFIASSVKNGHAEELILASQLCGKKVSLFVPDPKTGVLVPNDGDGRVEHTLTIPQNVVIPRCPESDELKAKFNFINTPAEASERLRMVPDCIKGIRDLNYFGRSTLARQNSNNLADQFFGKERDNENLDNPHKFSLSRSAMQSHVFAYLMTEKKMTPEQIADPGYEPGKKLEAGAYIKGIMTSENGDLDKLAEYNVNGIVKMKEYISGKLAGKDITDASVLYAEENMYIFPLSHFIVDLDQEQKFMQSSVDKALEAHFDAKTSEELKTAKEKWNDEIKVNTVFSGTDDAMMYNARFRTGSTNEAVTHRASIIQQELFKKAVSDSVKNGESIFSVLDEVKLTEFQVSSISAATSKKSDGINKGIEEFNKVTSVKTPEQIRGFAKFVDDGGIIKGGKTENGAFVYTPAEPADEKANDAEVMIKEEFILKK